MCRAFSTTAEAEAEADVYFTFRIVLLFTLIVLCTYYTIRLRNALYYSIRICIWN